MTQVKYDICEKAFYLNTATGRFEEVEIKGIQVVPTGISKDSDGRNVLDGQMVLYQTVDGPVLAECELFATVEEARAFWTEALKVA